MATLRNLKIKTNTNKRVLKELHCYEEEVEKEAAKTADMKEKGADPYDLKQQENVLAESRMMIPDCRKRLEASLADLKATLAEIKESEQEGVEIKEAENTISEIETGRRGSGNQNRKAWESEREFVEVVINEDENTIAQVDILFQRR